MLLRRLSAPRPLLLLAFCSAGCPKPDQGIVAPSVLHTIDEDEKGIHAVSHNALGRSAYIIGNKVCAEPPPDVAANLSTDSSLKAQIEASAELEAIEAALGLDIESQRKTTSEIIDVVKRSETVLLMRDALYRLCEQRMNGNISETTAKEEFLKLLVVARQLGQRDNAERLIEAYEATLKSDLPGDKKAELAERVLAATLRLSFVEAAQGVDSQVLKDVLTLAPPSLTTAPLPPQATGNNQPNGGGAQIITPPAPSGNKGASTNAPPPPAATGNSNPSGTSTINAPQKKKKKKKTKTTTTTTPPAP